MGNDAKKISISKHILWNASERKIILEERALELRQELRENKRTLKMHSQAYPTVTLDTTSYIRAFRKDLKKELKQVERELKQYRLK